MIKNWNDETVSFYERHGKKSGIAVFFLGFSLTMLHVCFFFRELITNIFIFTTKGTPTRNNNNINNLCCGLKVVTLIYFKAKFLL